MGIRIYTKDVERCIECPAVTYDMNVTRWLCSRTRTMICWMGEEEETAPIPNNCPLPIKED